MKQDKPIGPALAFGLVITALIVDGLQFILTILMIGVVMNPILDFCAYIIFTLMLAHHGGGALRRSSISMTLTVVAEFIPILSAFPVWTLFAIYTILSSKIKKVVNQPPEKKRSSALPRL